MTEATDSRTQLEPKHLSIAVSNILFNLQELQTPTEPRKGIIVNVIVVVVVVVVVKTEVKKLGAFRQNFLLVEASRCVGLTSYHRKVQT